MAKKLIKTYTKEDGTIVSAHLREVSDCPSAPTPPSAGTLNPKLTPKQHKEKMLGWLTDSQGESGMEMYDVSTGKDENGWSRDWLYADRQGNEGGDYTAGACFTSTYFHEGSDGTGTAYESVVYVEFNEDELNKFVEEDEEGAIDEDDPYTWPGSVFYITGRSGTGTAVRNADGDWEVEEIDDYDYEHVGYLTHSNLLDYELEAGSYAMTDDRQYLWNPDEK